MTKIETAKNGSGDRFEITRVSGEWYATQIDGLQNNYCSIPALLHAPSRGALMSNLTNMPWAVYRCDLIGRGETPRNEVLVSGHLTPSEAMDEANRLKRQDRAHSYTVGAA